MRRWLAASLLLVVLAVTAAGTDTEAQQRWVASHPTVRVAIDGQQAGEIKGSTVNPLVSQYMALAGQKTGIRFVTVRMPSWDAAVTAFHEGKVDLLPTLTDRLVGDIANDAVLSRPFYVGRTIIITRTVGPSRIRLADLDGRTVAFKGGGEYESWLRREHPAINRLPLADVHQVLAAVESGIADAGIGIDVAYHPMVRRDYALSLRVSGDIPEMPVAVRVAVHQDAPALLAIIDDSMGRITPAENEAVIERWLETAYLRAPTVAHIVAVYRVEIGLGIALLVALVFALWQMRRAQVASRRGEQQKTLLLAVMSHEVRNAVNAVASSIELVARSPLDASQRELMGLAQSSARNLQGLLRSALDYTRTETEGFTADLVSCDALAVAREVIQGQRTAIEQKGLSVRLDMPMGPLPWLLLDETRLRQLLENLLANAVKFTERGHVGIALWQAVPPTASRQLIVEVFDTGVGVPDSRQKDLFRPFSQAHGRRSRRLGGSGLGLGICREIVGHLGGRLAFTSEEGVGTSVRIELPTSLVPAAAASVETAPTQNESTAQGTVLLVEDHPANRQIIAAQLRFLGFDTFAVDHGQAAIDAWEPGRFVAVLLDCELPDMQGYDIAAELRAREASAGDMRTPFVAISANTGEDHLHRCRASGIDVVMGKPLSLDKLRDTLTPSAPIDPLTLFRAEALRDLDAALDAARAGQLDDARRSLHRLQGAAQVLRLPLLDPFISGVSEALPAPAPILEARAHVLRTALERTDFTVASRARG